MPPKPKELLNKRITLILTEAMEAFIFAQAKQHKVGHQEYLRWLIDTQMHPEREK